VALAFNKSLAVRLIKWEPVNERILWAVFRFDGLDLKIVVVYGPVEGTGNDEADSFFEEIDRTVKTTNRIKVIILGDLNSRVGNDNRGIEEVMDIFGENGVPNLNGKRLIDLCMGNDLIITNTIFRHKDIHKFTWCEETRNRKSLIDYIIVEKSLRNTVKDTRVYRGFEIGSDHFLVSSVLRINFKMVKKPFKVVRRIRADRLQDVGIRQLFQRSITEAYIHIEKTACESIDVEWDKYKCCLVEAAKRSCGVVVCKDRETRTP